MKALLYGFLKPEIIETISVREYVKNFTNFSCQREVNFISIRGV